MDFGKITHPSTDHPRTVRRLFVASGTVNKDAKDFHVLCGYLISHVDATKFYEGTQISLRCPPKNGAPTEWDHKRWAILFRIPPEAPAGDYSLRVYGLSVNNTQKDTAKAVRLQESDVYVTLGDANEEIDRLPVTITDPGTTDSMNICASSFSPYGTYTPAGTISVALTGAFNVTAPQVTQITDANGNAWYAEFDPLSVQGVDQSHGSTLIVKDSHGTIDSTSISSLTFDGSC